MAWVRLDDGYPEHPKVERVGPYAAWLNVCAWAYSARNLTDGFVPIERAPRLAQVPHTKQLIAALLEVELWHPAESPCARCLAKRESEHSLPPPGDGFLVHDYLEYNRSREQILKERAATAERVAESRARRGNRPKPPTGNGVTSQPSNSVTNGVSTAAPVPAHVRPSESDDSVVPNGTGDVDGPSPGDDRVDAVYGHFRARIQPRSRLCPRKRIAARLKHFTADELLEGIDHFADDPWWMDHCASRGADWFFESDSRAEQFLLLTPRKVSNVLPLARAAGDGRAPRRAVDVSDLPF